MKRYRNLEGHSGVVAYEIGDRAIKVRFRDGDTYLYNDAATGAAAVASMQALALAGRGLSTFISKYVRDKYAAKL